MQGPDFYIDEEGLAMPLDQLNSARVPIIHARDIAEAMPAVDFLAKVEGDVFWESLIDQILVDASGKITILPRIGAPLFLGSELEPLDQKRNLLTFYKEHIKTGNLKKYRKIDLSYADQVIATKYAHLNYLPWNKKLITRKLKSSLTRYWYNKIACFVGQRNEHGKIEILGYV